MSSPKILSAISSPRKIRRSLMTSVRFQQMCSISGIICPVLFFAALISGSFLPPLKPSLSAEEVAHHYQKHATGIRVGSILMLLSGMFYAAYTAVITGQMNRIPGLSPTVGATQLAAGAFACLTFLVPAMAFATTAYRPYRPAELTVILNDQSWIYLVMPWPPFMTENFAFAFGILSDPQERPIFPRWLAYVNIISPIVFTPAVAVPFVMNRWVSWNGIFSFWIPGAVFFLQFVANVVMLFKAIQTEEVIDDHEL